MYRILIAEDDDISRRLVVEVVENMGHIAIQCGNGKQAWDILRFNPNIDLLITDMMMPELDGAALVKIIRGNEKLKSLPILMLSAVVGLKDVMNILELGASRFLSKPVRVEELREYIEILIEKGR